MCEYMYSNFVSCASSVSFEKYLSFFRSKRVNAFTVTIVFIVSYAKPKRFSWNCSNQQPHRNQTHWEPTMARFTWLKGRGRLCSMISIGDHTHRSRMSSNQIAFFEYYSLVQLISIDRRFIFCLLSHWCTISVTHSTSKQQTAHITSHRRAHKFVGKVLVLHWKNPKLACELSKTCTNISLIDRLKNWRAFSLSLNLYGLKHALVLSAFSVESHGTQWARYFFTVTEEPIKLKLPVSFVPRHCQWNLRTEVK